MLINMVRMMLGTKYPFEYELSPDVTSQNAGESRSYVVKLKNISSGTLTDLEVELWLVDTRGIVISDEERIFGSLMRDESETMSFPMHASEIGQAYLFVSGHEKNSEFYWDIECGEVCSKQKSSAKEKIEARVAEIKAEAAEGEEAFDKWSKKNEEDVEKRMTGEANA